jgi:hypothetical protein
METIKSSASAPVTPIKREKPGSHQGMFVTTLTCTCVFHKELWLCT